MKDQNKSNIRIVQLSDYVTPPIKEVPKSRWVEYGENNDYFGYLIDLYNNSPTHNACVKAASEQIYGQGLEAVRGDRKLDGYIMLKKMFSPHCLRNISSDFGTFGMAAFELIRNKTKDKWVKAYHMPMQYLRSSICNEDGDVEDWFYSTNWNEAKKKQYKPEVVKDFHFAKPQTDERCVYVIKPYSIGNAYYSLPDYIGGVQWAEIESEVSNFHLSNLKNGMFPGMLINFNNGVPSEDEQIEIERDVKRKWGGSSNAGRFVIAFNRDKESAATAEPIQLSDASEQFKSISDEASRKIMLSHRVTSPMLLGIKDNTGLGNNADELKTAHALYYNTTIRPKQNVILEAIDEILAANNASLDIYFKPLTPLEFKEYEIPIDKETQEKETGVTMSATEIDLADDVANDWLEFLNNKGEVVDKNEWELEYEEVVDPQNEDKKINLFKRFAEPQSKSVGDSGLYKIRYRYSQQLSQNSRIFCKNMVANSKQGVVYRKEDIDLMSQQKLNIELSPADCKRCGYDIWLHKGGANCGHYWVRQVYTRRRDARGRFQPISKSPKMEQHDRVSVNKATKAGVPQSKLEPKGWDQAQTRPRDTSTKGYKR